MIFRAFYRLSLLSLLYWAPLCPCWPQGVVSEDFDTIAESLFWDELHPYGGWTLFCGDRFDHDRKTTDRRTVILMHLYPLEKMLLRAGCNSRMQCRESGNALFRRMEADMHNLYADWSDLVTRLNGMEFGEVAGEEWRYQDCDFEWRKNLIEPRPVSRGNIARALYYMHWRYDLPLWPPLIQTLKRWNREDGPSEQERFRNDRIEVLQGERNPFIDDPLLMDNPPPTRMRKSGLP